MAEMGWFGRWMVNVSTSSRARRVLGDLGSHLTVPEGAHVLELGMGGGGLVALVQERYHPARLVGTDFDPAQVAATNARLRRRWGTIPAGVATQVADALALPFPDASFDFVFAIAMLHHVEAHHTEYSQRPRALAEIRRVLRPGGRLVYSDLFRREEIRRSLAELGFREEFLRSGWRHDLAIYRAPSSPAVSSERRTAA